MAETFFLTSTALASGAHVGDNETAIGLTVGDSTELTAVMAGGDNRITHLFTGTADVPNNADWTTGDYSASFNVTTAGADILYYLANIGAAGHFARVNSSLVDQITREQIEARFSGTGIKVATTGSVNFGTASDTDRFELALEASRASSHGNQTLGITCDSNSSVTGPWAAAGSDTNVNTTTKALAITANVASVNAETNVNTTTKALSISPGTASIKADTTVNTTTKSLSISTGTASVNAETNVNTITKALSISAGTANISIGGDTNVIAISKALALAAGVATINAETNVNTTTKALSISTGTASINAETAIVTNTHALTIMGNVATISVGGGGSGPVLNIHYRTRSPSPQQEYKTSKPQGVYLSKG